MPIRSMARAAALVLAGALAWGAPLAAHAQEKASKTKKTEGCLVSIDANAGKMVVKDRLTKKEETYRVKQATSVLDKNGTVVTKNGSKAQLVELEVNRPIFIYWIVDPQDPNGKFANKADAPDPMNRETKQLDEDTMENFGCKMGS
ncbi:MAG TPA: hypothetical protein VMH82_16880 [Myxococcota bacterium]|nr:hypothetical protein [Myxococcota bacterium]